MHSTPRVSALALRPLPPNEQRRVAEQRRISLANLAKQRQRHGL